MKNGTPIIDADGHIMESEAELLRKLPPDARERRCLFPLDTWQRYLEGHPTEKRRGDLRTRLADMESEGIDISVLYPTLGLNHVAIPETGWAVDLARAYNEYLSEICAGSNGTLAYVAVLPIQDMKAALEELHRAVTKLNAAGAMLPCNGPPADLGSTEFWPLYEEAERLGVGLGVHGNSFAATGIERFQSFIKVHTVAFPVDIMIALTGIVLGGVPERFPRLKLAFLEAGVGWVPYWLERMDEEWERRRAEAPLVKRRPSEYCTGGNIFFSCEAEEKGLASAIETLGEDVVLWASDYPHWDMTWPGMVDDIMKRKDVSESAKRKLFFENPHRFYRLDGRWGHPIPGGPR